MVVHSALRAIEAAGRYRSIDVSAAFSTDYFAHFTQIRPPQCTPLVACQVHNLKQGLHRPAQDAAGAHRDVERADTLDHHPCLDERRGHIPQIRNQAVVQTHRERREEPHQCEEVAQQYTLPRSFRQQRCLPSEVLLELHQQVDARSG